MTLITDAELADLRADVAELLTDTCEIIRTVETPDGMGGYTESESTAIASLACRVDPITEREREALLIDEQQQLRASYVMYFSYDQDLEVGDVARYDGNDFEVVLEHEKHSKRSVAHAVLISMGGT